MATDPMKNDKETGRIQIRSFWISEKQTPFVYKHLKKNNSSTRGDQITLIRDAISTGLALNNLVPGLGSFINALGDRLTLDDVKKYISIVNGNEKDNLSDNITENFTEKFSQLLEDSFSEFFQKLNGTVKVINTDRSVEHGFIDPVNTTKSADVIPSSTSGVKNEPGPIGQVTLSNVPEGRASQQQDNEPVTTTITAFEAKNESGQFDGASSETQVVAPVVKRRRGPQNQISKLAR